MKIVLISILVCAGCFAQAPKAPVPSIPAPSAPTKPAAAPARPLTAEQAARMKAIDATQAQFELKIDELIQMVQKGLQAQRNEVWAAACQAAGWDPKKGECQVDPASAMISKHEDAPVAK